MAVVLVVFAALAWSATSATAQVVEKPSAVTWDHADFATATSYVFGYFLLPVNPDGTCNASAQPAADPYMQDTFAKPSTTSGLGMTALLVAKPIGCYVAKMKAVDASGLTSVWSDVTGPFVFRPAAPVPRAIK